VKWFERLVVRMREILFAAQEWPEKNWRLDLGAEAF
jgi:hypothetical protein